MNSDEPQPIPTESQLGALEEQILAIARQHEAVAVHPELARFQQRAARETQELPEGRLADPDVFVAAEQMRYNYFLVAEALIAMSPASRERSIALTELETSMMYAIKGLYA